MKHERARLLRQHGLLLACAAAAACAGTIVDPDSDGKGGGGTGSSSGVPGPSVASQCVDADVPDVGVSPLRRLTRLEYDNTVRDLLGDTSAPATSFSPDEEVAGFNANSVATVSKLQTEDYLDAAEKLAKTAVGKLSTLVDCDVALTSCVRPFIDQLGRRAYRRPLSGEELDTYTAAYESARGQWGATSAVELSIRALLSSPAFLYHVETTKEGSSAALAPVDAHTLAARLSYFLWSSMPDDELFAAVDAGELDTPDGVEKQARRMLADPKAAASVADFHEQWLRIRGIEEVAKDTELFPAWDTTLAQSMREETRRFVTHVVLEGDAKLSTLLTASYSFVDPALAEIYGVQGPASGFAKTELDPKQRSGLLTHASLMTSHSGASETSWVHRGKLVREQFLCDILPAPPPGVEATDPKDPGRLENPECMGCHLKMDPIGTGFDAYGAIGNYRLEDEHGKTVSTDGDVIDDSGEIDASGKFVGAVELAQRLSQSDYVARCVAVHWFRFAARRIETKADACTIATVQDVFTKNGNDVRELMVALAKTPAFRYRRVTE